MKVLRCSPCFKARVTLMVYLGFALAFCASAQQSSSGSIVGRWRSVETSKGGIGATIEFRADGTVDTSPGAIVEMTWRIENNQLILPAETNGGSERKSNLKWLTDNKLRLQNEASVIDLTRVGDHFDPRNPIVGEWIENREMAGRSLEAHWLVYDGGKLLFIMPFASQHESYTVSGSTIHLKSPQRETENRFKLSDDSLTLSDPDSGREFHYARY